LQSCMGGSCGAGWTCSRSEGVSRRRQETGVRGVTPRACHPRSCGLHPLAI